MIHFIGGEKGGVGKSMVARLLSQYCLDRQVPHHGFDADSSHGTLSRYYGDYTSALNLDDYASIDQVVEKPSPTIAMSSSIYLPKANVFESLDRRQ